jgi:hypothetical protein
LTGEGAVDRLPGDDVPTDELMELIRLWALERWPRRPVQRITIELADGDKVKMPMSDVPYKPATAPNPRAAGAGAEKVYPTERRILEAVAGMDKENPTAAEIAAAAGMTDGPHFHKWLFALRMNGRLGGKAGTDAYPLTPKGQAAIEPP